MAAYAALLSLKQTIDGLAILTDENSTSTVPILQHMYEAVWSLQEVLSKLDKNSIKIIGKQVNAVNEDIREAVSKFEDALELHASNQFLTQSADISSLLLRRRRPLILPSAFSLDLQELSHDVHSFAQTLDKLKHAYIEALSCGTLEEEEEEDDDDEVRQVEFEMMLGLSDQYMEIRDHLITSNDNIDPCRSITLWGMAGIGKTTLAKKLFQDPLISGHFDRRAFVALGPKCRIEDVYLGILKQVAPADSDIDGKVMHAITQGGDEEEEVVVMMHVLKRMINECLQDRRFFIILDDVWGDDEILNLECFRTNTVKGGRVLLTTRLKEVAQVSWHCEIRFLNKKESWDLLRHKVFDEMLCPTELEKAGKKIAENCQGLPLTIITVANMLSKAGDKTPEYWNKVAADPKKTIIMDAYGKMYKVLYPSYNYLSQYLKPLFLYMGVFPQDCEIHYSKLAQLCNVEGLHYEEMDSDSYYHYIAENSLAMILKRRFNDEIKIISLHSAIWYLCNKEAGKNKFFHGLNYLDDCLAPGMSTQRRLSVRNNVLFGVRDAYDSMASASVARSLLCTGSYHQYPVPICFGLMLLRVLDALTIRFYEFPMEVLKLVRLKYFAFTFNGDLPSSIGELWNLKFLIVNRHVSIVKSSSYMPMEIWDMKELKHIQVKGSDLPEPCKESSSVLHIITLLDVSARSCTEGVLKRLPHLSKLGIRIELSPDEDDVEPLYCFDHISCLRYLTALKCAVVNPRIMSEINVPLSTLSSNLRKLTLSGLGYPWEKMCKISLLPNLVVLKLLCYAFQGPEWHVYGYEFPSLDYLLIEDTDLVHWKIEGYYGLQSLVYLSVKHCYKLQELPLKFSECLGKIELVDCNPVVVTFANKLKDRWDRKRSLHYHGLDLNVQSSWDD